MSAHPLIGYLLLGGGGRCGATQRSGQENGPNGTITTTTQHRHSSEPSRAQARRVGKISEREREKERDLCCYLCRRGERRLESCPKTKVSHLMTRLPANEASERVSERVIRAPLFIDSKLVISVRKFRATVAQTKLVSRRKQTLPLPATE